MDMKMLRNKKVKLILWLMLFSVIGLLVWYQSQKWPVHKKTGQSDHAYAELQDLEDQYAAGRAKEAQELHKQDLDPILIKFVAIVMSMQYDKQNPPYNGQTPMFYQFVQYDIDEGSRMLVMARIVRQLPYMDMHEKVRDIQASAEAIVDSRKRQGESFTPDELEEARQEAYEDAVWAELELVAVLKQNF